MRRLFAAVVVCLLPGGTPAATQSAHPPIRLFLEAGGADEAASRRAIAAIGRQWRDGYTAMFVDMARLLAPRRVNDELAPHPIRVRLIQFLEVQTKQRFGDDLQKWRDWYWNRPYDPHPDYAAFKAAVYERIDPRMARYFDTPKATIRLDEVDWGGVAVNGIPPLDHPKVVTPRDASWLRDDHIIFGIVSGTEARAYPKRILAWHEMALDRLGGIELAIVYCTLCGTVIPYKAEVGGTRRTFGTSGLLYRSNKLMFDKESMSLWSTLDGRPVVGALAGQPLTLDMLPVVTTTWREWRAAHPATTVVSLDTGHDRDYSEGAAYRDYFSHDRLMFRVPKLDTRLNNKDEVLGLLVPAVGGGRLAVAFSASYLQRNRVHHESVESRQYVVLTSPGGANRVYELTGNVRIASFNPGNPGNAGSGGEATDASGARWRVTEEALVSVTAPATRLMRVPAFRAFWFGWYAQFPETRLVK